MSNAITGTSFGVSFLGAFASMAIPNPSVRALAVAGTAGVALGSAAVGLLNLGGDMLLGVSARA